MSAESNSAAERSNHDVTQLLKAAADGDSSAMDRLVPIVYDELKRVAHRQQGRLSD